MNVFVARQPIFDRTEKLVGYELLYRNTALSTMASGAAADTMCTDTVIHAFLDIGIDELTDGKLAFINCTQDFLLGRQVELLPQDRVVVEILETVGTSEPIIQACQALRDRGYVIALDDYVDSPSQDPLLQIARVVKLDVLHTTPEELSVVVKRLAPFGVRLLAERVETKEMYQACRALGFELFQGYYFSRPELVMTREVSVGFANMAHLLNVLGNPDATDTEIEGGFRTDPALTYKLLRIVNSAAIGGRGVDSIPFAIRMVGRQMLRRWLSLLMVSSMVGGSALSDQLVYTSLLRARMCELIAEASPQLRGAQALFMTGLFSMLDVLLQMSMHDVFKRVHVAHEIYEAVVERTGPYAGALQLAEAYQNGAWEQVDAYAAKLGLLPVQVPWLYTKSLAWVSQQLVVVQDAAA